MFCYLYSLIKKAMIIGVGVGKYVESAIYASMKMNNPNFVVFIVSPDSKGTLDRPVQQYEHLRDICECEEFAINDPEDIDGVFRSCEEALFFLFEKGFSASEIVVDITSGTKVMSAAIAALAILHKLYSITYVGGGRRNEGGIVMQGTEKPKELKPVSILYKHELAVVKNFFSKYQFYTCRLMIQDLVGKFKDLEKESESINDIEKIINGFISWERFDHEHALEFFEGVQHHDVKIQVGYLRKVKDDRKTEAAKHPSLKGKVPTKHLIVDMFQNARRRADEGNFDDAVARLYRCVEMVGQYALLQYGIVSSDVDLEKLQGKITDTLFQKLEKHKDCDRIKIGLVEDFEILSELNKNDNTAIAYSKHREDLKRYLNFRNESILAHGMNPIDKEQYTKMSEIVYEIVKSAVSDVDEKLSEINRCFDPNVLSRNYAGS
jgi:CRISPR-associated protein (TIGR02710 family)